MTSAKKIPAPQNNNNNGRPPAAAASLDQTKKALNDTASKHGFRCVPVSWEDAQRGTVGGALSCWGGNISDVRLWAKDGTLLYTLRTENWNERLGYVASKDVAVVVGSHERGGSQPTPITLQAYLKKAKQYMGYAGVESEQLWDDKVDQLLSVRFQAVFLPIASSSADDGCPSPSSINKDRPEFCTEVYNYNTRSDDDPRNMILLCTAQGTSAQQDGAGAKKLFLHNVDGSGTVHRYWLEAEQSRHQVGGAQLETDEEAAAAAARGKATAIHIGTKEMGTRFNVQMMIQLPLQQKKQQPQRNGGFFGGAGGVDGCVAECGFGLLSAIFGSSCAAPPPPKMMSASSAAPSGCPAPSTGTSNAARVSRGSEYDSTWRGVENKTPTRDSSQHGTITVTLYYTVAGGVPSPADVEACVADLDALYKACPTDKRLVDCSEITAELTVKDTIDIKHKVTTQAYKPPVFAPAKSTFPVDDE